MMNGKTKVIIHHSAFIIFLVIQVEDRSSGLPASPTETVATRASELVTRVDARPRAPLRRAIDPMPSDVARVWQTVCKASFALPCDSSRCDESQSWLARSNDSSNLSLGVRRGGCSVLPERRVGR